MTKNLKEPDTSLVFDDNQPFSFMMPAGKYYVGDPCYSVSDDTWTDLLKQLIVGPKCMDGKFVLPDGRVIVAVSTAFGNGTYSDDMGHRFGVDSGCLGLVRVKHADNDEDADEDYTPIKISFKEPFEVKSNGKGLITFGPLSIDTTKSADENDSDDDEEEDNRWDFFDYD